MSKIQTIQEIERKIYLIRGRRVMLDSDLAVLYGAETKTLNQAVKRNPNRFPPDFMYHLTRQEVINLKSQFVTSSWGGIRKSPFVFTENGVAMLSSVLHSEEAIEVNIQIMRTFIKLREIMSHHEELRRKIEAMEKNIKDRRILPYSEHPGGYVVFKQNAKGNRHSSMLYGKDGQLVYLRIFSAPNFPRSAYGYCMEKECHEESKKYQAGELIHVTFYVSAKEIFYFKPDGSLIDHVTNIADY